LTKLQHKAELFLVSIMFGTIYLLYPKNKKNIKLYVGGTINMKRRKYRHKQNCCNPNNDKYNTSLYRHIRDNGGWTAFEFGIVEQRDDFIDEEDLRKREQYHMDRIPKQFSLNEISAYRTAEQLKQQRREARQRWRKANPEKLAEYNKKWLEKNPAYMRDYMRALYWRKKEKKEEIKQQNV